MGGKAVRATGGVVGLGAVKEIFCKMLRFCSGVNTGLAGAVGDVGWGGA